MGGFSSGRYRTRNQGAMEQSLRLDIRRLRRDGFLVDGQRKSGTISWTYGHTPTGSISFTIDLRDPYERHAILRFSVDGEPRTQKAWIDAVACRYGGLRFYFLCPRINQRCEVLCGVGGVFACRDYHRLNYQTQCADRLTRLSMARQKAEARAIGLNGYPVPRGANATRLREKWIELEEAADSQLALEFYRLWGRHGLTL